MKTTVDISDPLMKAAKELAAREGITLRELIEEGLRWALADRRSKKPFHLRDATFGGDGLRPEVADGGWPAIRERAYEGRGG